MSDAEAVQAGGPGVLVYVEGWFEGDALRMERVLHPELIKRRRGIEGDDPDAFSVTWLARSR